MGNSWFEENGGEGEHHLYACRQVLHAGITQFQSVRILDTLNHGKMLVLDGKVQSAETDEFIYHEALIHPGMMTHPNPRRILIIGGGEGASLREVLRYPSVEQVTMVELDEDVVHLARAHLKEWHRGAFEHPKTRLVFEDGRAHLEKTESAYDVIVIDVTDLLDGGPACALYTKEFYGLVRRRLAAGGLLIVQGLELSSLTFEQHATLAATLGSVFPLVRSYKTFVPAFWSEWGFLIASEHLDPVQVPRRELEERIAKRFARPPSETGPLKFYDADLHFSLFQLPNVLRRKMSGVKTVLTDRDLGRKTEDFALAASSRCG